MKLSSEPTDEGNTDNLSFMKKAYLLVYSDNIGDRASVKAIIDSIPGILNWRYDMPNCFYIISEKTAQELVNLIESKIHSASKRFFITEISTNRQGYLPKDTWDFIDVTNR